jgi:hypothetical protein
MTPSPDTKPGTMYHKGTIYLDPTAIEKARPYGLLIGKLWARGATKWEAEARGNKQTVELPKNPRGNRRPSRFTEKDISRAIRGVEKSGKQVGKVKIDTDGSIQVAIESFKDISDPTSVIEFNEWDTLKRR